MEPGYNSSSKLLNRSLSLHSSTSGSSSSTKPHPPSNSISLQRSGTLKGTVERLRNLFEKKPSSPSKLKDESQPPHIRFPSNSPTGDKLKKAPDDDDDWQLQASAVISPSKLLLPGTDDRVVVYFTSLRGVRRTYGDCCAVRMILGGFRVFVDERDISMDSAYKKELHRCLLGKNCSGSVGLPQVFIRGYHIGGAEVIKHLHDIGELGKMLRGLPTRPIGACHACANVRFIPCFHCNGSRKVYDEDEDDMGCQHHLKRCVYCNENGLLRCPTCCSS